MSALDDDRLRHLIDVAAAADDGGDEPGPLPETVGDGRYEIREEVARGGMGRILRARDRRLDRDVAIKLLSLEDPAGEVARRMIAEAKVLARLEHPGIVPVHDVGVLGDGRVFVAMKLVDGKRLDEHAAELTAPNDRLRLFLRVCEPVAFAHERGVIHRDLKPANVMVGPFGEVLVMDWGVARAAGTARAEARGADRTGVAGAEPNSEAGTGSEGSDAGTGSGSGTGAEGGVAGHATRVGTVLGTPGWMAPEQAAGEAVDGRADVYALGAILRALAPPRGEGGDARLEAVIARATAATPTDRYPSVADLAEEVTRWLDGAPVRAYRERWLERLRRVVRRHLTPILIIVSYLVVRWIVYLVARV